MRSKTGQAASESCVRLSTESSTVSKLAALPAAVCEPVNREGSSSKIGHAHLFHVFVETLDERSEKLKSGGGGAESATQHDQHSRLAKERVGVLTLFALAELATNDTNLARLSNIFSSSTSVTNRPSFESSSRSPESTTV